MNLTLRPYQDASLDAVREMFLGGCRRVVLYAPTGSGKTEIALAITRLAGEKGKRTLFAAHRIELVNQAWRRFRKSGIDAGVIQGDNTRRLDLPVIIGSVQTIARRGAPEFDLLIIDEAHRAAQSKAYEDLIRKAAGKHVIGLSATPFARGMSREIDGVGKLFEGIAKATTIRELIDLGFLVDVDVYGPSEPDVSKVRIVAGDYHEGQLAEAVDKPKLVGDIVSHWHRLGAGKQTVVFATSIAHSQHIVEQFVASGVNAEHLDCYTEDEDRAAVLSRFERGETTIVSNVGILAEGWDCPACEVMILARPTRSLSLFIQMCGRILRPAEGKTKGTILDHSGSCKRLGFPTDDLPLELDDGKRKESSEPMPPKERLPEPCPSCSFMLMSKVRKCPKCGFEPKREAQKVDAAAGDLVQLKRGKVAAADKAQVYAELLGYARSKGYAEGWAAHKCRELFGTWPAKKEGVDPATPSADTMKLIRYLNIRNAKAREARAS